MDDRHIIAIEIGSSNVKGAIGIYGSSGVLTVQAVEEEQMHDWVRYGAVSNVEEVAKLVARIIRKIENRVAPRKVTTVYVGMGGRSFCSVKREVECRLHDDMEITEDVLDRLEHDARALPYSDRELLAVVPREYYVDKALVEHPKGFVGRNVRMIANLITCRMASKRNLDLLFSDKLKLNVDGYVVRHLALGKVVLTNDETRLGCMLVDFGAETTAVSIYKHGHLQYMATLPLGSRHITRDITRLNYLEEQAEEIKRTIGNALGASVSGAGQPLAGVDYSAVNNYVGHRAGEIIANIREQVKLAGFTAADLPTGIILVGRGALLSGFSERLNNATTMKVRSGNIIIPEVRFADSRIAQADACDVVAVLYEAACRGVQECLSVPVVEPEPEPEPEPEINVDIAQEEPEPIKNPKEHGKSGWWREKLKGIKGGIANLMTEVDDDELRDDE